ncbi:MAG TPA: hypothetical protein VLA89_00155 [Gemmatimonadales bacterium]|nr:hypothetical protein [Gemmatimonadales bacterium]
MQNNRLLSVVASTMTLAAIPALVSACGGGDDDDEATQPVPTEPGGNTTNATATQAPSVANHLMVDLDTLRGSKNISAEDKPTQSCVQLNMFAKNEQIVFRVRVYDPTTGKAMDNTTIDKVEIKFKNGTTLDPMKYGPHPKDPPNEAFWTQSFVIPEDFPTGALDFTVTATDKEGRSGTFTPIHYAPSALLQILDKVRPVISQ